MTTILTNTDSEKVMKAVEYQKLLTEKLTVLNHTMSSFGMAGELSLQIISAKDSYDAYSHDVDHSFSSKLITCSH